MVIYYKSVIGLLFIIFILGVNSDSPYTSRAEDDKNKIRVDNVQQQRLCNQSTLCSSITDRPKHGDLRSQNCMCDEQCSQYGDCCKGSGISNTKSNFTCISTAQDDNHYMKTTCPSTWQGPANIKYNCENATNSDHKLDVPLVIPVTSQKNITYRNLFCALCNDEDAFHFWKVGIWAGHNSSLNESLDKLTLVTDHINAISIKAKIPADLTNKVRYCLPNVIDNCPLSWKNCPDHTFYVYHGNKTFKNIECLQCNENSTLTNDICIPSEGQGEDILLIEDSLQSFLQDTLYCLSQNYSAVWLFCTEETSSPDIDPCSTPKGCEINSIFNINDENIKLIGNDTVLLKVYDLELKNSIEGTPQWIFINESAIFVCGMNITKSTWLDEVSSLLSDILIKLSLICLILHLVVVLQLPQLRNTPGKSLAAYSFSLLIVFLCLDLDTKWGLCKYTSVILHYSLLSCFTWMLLMSFNCWQATYRATKLRQSSEKKSRKFLWYTLIAIFIPLLIVSIGVYLDNASVGKVPCNWKPGYGSGGECFISGTKSFLALFIIPSSVLFVTNNLFFAHTAYLIYFNQRRNTITKQDRINFKLYIRLALIMGSTWTFGTIYTFTEWPVIQILFIVLNMSLGIFIFIAFTLQKRNLKMLRSKYAKNRRIAGLLTWCLGETAVADETITESLRLK